MTTHPSPGLFSDAFPPKALWSVDDIPDLTGRVIVGTGFYGGIGFETLKACLSKSGKVYVLGRNKAKFAACLERLPSGVSVPSFVECDLSSLESIRNAARELRDKEKRIDVLFCNAGNLAAKGETTDRGIDAMFGTNVLGHFYLIKLLLPLLQSDTLPLPRIVHTSSMAAAFAPSPPEGPIDYSSLKGESVGVVSGFGMLSKGRLYGQSKIGNIIVANELHRRYGSKLVSTSVHPGSIQSGLGDNLISSEGLLASAANVFKKATLHPPAMGALTQLYAGLSPETADKGGEFFIPWARLGKAPDGADDKEVGRKLWDWLENQVEEFEAEKGPA